MARGTDEIQALLGQGTEFHGELRFEGTVRIDGIFRGEVQSTGTLVVGEGARVEAEIHCATLIISGEVQGNVVASQRVEARAPAKISGNIQSPVLVINEGVLFEGNSRMDTSMAKEEEPERKIPFLGKREKKPTESEEASQLEGS